MLLVFLHPCSSHAILVSYQQASRCSPVIAVPFFLKRPHGAVVLVRAHITGLATAELEWLPHGRGVDHTLRLEVFKPFRHEPRVERDDARLLTL